jgi:hypothetical protein
MLQAFFERWNITAYNSLMTNKTIEQYYALKQTLESLQNEKYYRTVHPRDNFEGIYLYSIEGIFWDAIVDLLSSPRNTTSPIWGILGEGKTLDDLLNNPDACAQSIEGVFIEKRPVYIIPPEQVESHLRQLENVDLNWIGDQYRINAEAGDDIDEQEALEAYIEDMIAYLIDLTGFVKQAWKEKNAIIWYNLPQELKEWE